MESNQPFISAPLPPEVTKLSLDELEELAECEELLEDFVTKLPQLSSITEECDKLALENRELAKSNLELSQSYENARDKTLQGVEVLTDLHQSFDNLTAQSMVLTQKLLPPTLQENMMIAAAESEEASEQLAENFLDKQLDVDTFLKTYMEKRQVSHLRKFKGDRLGAQLLELQKAGF